MAITIGSNITALQAQRRLSGASSSLAKIFERLTSGLRINRASDDAAGLSIADTLRADSRIYSQAARNGNDGLSLLSISSGAIGELSNIVTRFAELAEQASNGIYSDKQRVPLDAEASALRDEYNRIIATTEYNGLKLLDGSISQLAVQLGLNGTASSQLSIRSGAFVSDLTWDGTYTTVSTTAFGSGVPNRVSASGDFTGDSVVDLIVTGSVGTYLLAGNGDGTFKSIVTLGVGSSGALASDYDRDGDLDFIARESSTLILFSNNGPGTFAKQSIGTIDFGSAVAIDDFNGDGLIDYASYEHSADEVSISYNQGGGTFGAINTFSIGFDGRGAVFGDVDNDGRLDLLVTGNGTSEQIFFHGNGNGTFGPAIALAGSPWTTTSLQIADINSDGINDIVQSDFYSASAVRVMYGNANGSFSASATLLTELSASASLADLTGDGNVDLYRARGGDTTAYIYSGDGHGSYQMSYTINLAAGDFNGLSAIDLNADGIRDFVVAAGPSGSGAILGYLAGTDQSFTLGSVSVATQQEARATLVAAKDLLGQISLAQGRIGADQSRLESALRNILVSNEDLLSAESQIRDADIAAESAEMIRTRLLQQAAAAVLSQANQQPALALKLLAGV